MRFNEAFPQSLNEMKGCIDYMRSTFFLAPRFILPLLFLLAFGLLLAAQPVFAQSSPPGAPTGLTATAVGTTTVELSWTAPHHWQRHDHGLRDRTLDRQRGNVGQYGT